MEFDLKSELRSYGATDDAIRLLKGPEHHLIDYLDLMPNNRTNQPVVGHVWLDAVVETQHQPLLYVVKSATLAQDIAARNEQIKKMRRDLACRGSGSYFAIIEPGAISVYPVGLSHDLPRPYTPSRQDNTCLLIQDLAHGHVSGKLTQHDPRERAVHELLYDLLNEVIDKLANLPPFSVNRDDDVDGKDEVLSLVGRALFTRFLIDRGIMTAETFPAFGDSFEECFNTATQATKTCHWLDEKFNGELLPLADKKYANYFQQMEQNHPEALKTLSNILYRATGGQLSFELYWNDINFAHVPVGLLSEVYERFAHRHFGEHADRESVHYTPRMVAEYMVNQSFPGITSSPPDRARVLDPSAGAGVFLVLCLRRLVAERWKFKGTQPQTADIRQILNEQIRGFDINGHALKLAALSLYLTALELDPDPFPPEKLVFAPLLGNVLFNARRPGEDFPYELPVLGSLGPAIDARHDKQYDLTIGNPPWTPWTGKGSDDLNKQVSEIIQGIARRRDPERLKEAAAGTYKNARKVSDLPFMWKAMEWAKPGGVIALAMSARILFSRNHAVASNREALFKALRITGILNGTALRRTKVWPTIKAPFCLMFAINRIPDDQEVFQFISPEIDFGCNENGRMRIDYANAHPIQFSVLRDKPTILKTLFRGNVLDADVMCRIGEIKTIPVSSYLLKLGLINHSEGYQLTWEPKNNKKGGDKTPVPEFYGKPFLTAHNAPTYHVVSESIGDKFTFPHLHRPRSAAIYKGPLLMLRSTMRPDRNHGCGIYSAQEILFNESFYGYSGHGHPFGEDVIRYLYVLSYSQLLYYTVLMTSAKFGFEREVIYKEDFDQFPLVPLKNLSEKQIEEMRQLSREIMDGDRPWAKVDAWVAGIYKLSASDQRVIADTLEVAMPFTSSITRSQEKPTKAEITVFSTTLENLLKPFFEITGEDIMVVPRTHDTHTWIFLDLLTKKISAQDRDGEDFTEMLKELANNEGASLIKAKIKDGHLLLGILAQYRYCTPSRCRLLSMNILRNSKDYFPVAAE
jgi:type I restriction-modification system DNA methylase subunit